MYRILQMRSRLLRFFMTLLHKRLRVVVLLLKQYRWEALLFGVLLGISLVAHAWNMFGFPYYENDEATYVSRGWAFITEGRLDVYTYRYDHAPLGWMLIGLWQLVTFGSHLFGSLLASGRIFMLALHVVSTILVYILAKRFSGGSKLAATVAVLFFALSPIAIYFQRRILLDNIMAFWVLLSLYFATQPVQRLKYFVLSGLVFGVAVLTKLNAVFFAPALLYLVWVRSHKHHRLHASAYWASVVGIIVGSFFLFALLKGELLSAPVGPDGNPTHVSVVDTFALQLGRGDFAWPWQYDSSFQSNVRSWLIKDWSLLAFGSVAALVLSVVGVRRRQKQPYILVLAALIVLYVAFLARGKIVLDLYIVPLIPLLALAIGVLVSIAYKDWMPSRLTKGALALLLVAVLGALALVLPTKQYVAAETANQISAAAWVRQHVPKDATIATDNYLYPYLAQESGYKNVTYFFSTEYDPEIRKSYANDWRNIEYLVLTHEIVEQIKTGTVPRMKHVLDHAELIADYRHQTSSYLDLPNYISTNGDWVQVYKTKSRNDIVMQDSWRHFTQNFIVSYGQVIDLSNKSLTTSGGQAEAMLRAVSVDDHNMFAGLWQWSKDHLRYRTTDKLLSWKWERGADGTYKLGDPNTVCDADQLIAYSLYAADEKWPGQGYGKEAAVHASDWWRECTFERGGKRYIDSSADGSQDIRLLNSGYFRPVVYRYLAQKMPDLPWGQLIDDGYELLSRTHAHFATFPDWFVMNVDGSLTAADPYLGVAASSFGYDALQLVPNLVQDYNVNSEPRSSALLKMLAEPVTAFRQASKSPPASIAGLLIEQTLQPKNRAAAQQTYEIIVHRPYESTSGHWADGKNFRDQMWWWQWHYQQSFFSERDQLNLR